MAKLEEIPRLLRLLATQAANIFNSRNIARSLTITHPTVQTDAKLLETIFLVKRIPAWRPGFGGREIHAPKVYIVDSGLLAHLLGPAEERIASDDQVTGKVVENFVAMEIAKHADWAETDARLYHYRQDRDEVDLVLETRAGHVAAVDVKASATIEERDYRAMAKLRDRRGNRFAAGVVIYTGRQTIPLSDRIWAVPVSGLWAAKRRRSRTLSSLSRNGGKARSHFSAVGKILRGTLPATRSETGRDGAPTSARFVNVARP